MFPGVLFAVLVGVRVMVVAVARTAAQAAAGTAANAAQSAVPGDRVAEGVLGARIALAAADGSAAETRPPAVVVEPERGRVQVLVFAGTISPVFGGIEFIVRACGPLDDITTSALASAGAWRC